MTDTAPTFKRGDWVRVMQTPTMERAGIANETGVIVQITGHLCDICNARGCIANIPAACLSHLEAKP